MGRQAVAIDRQHLQHADGPAVQDRAAVLEAVTATAPPSSSPLMPFEPTRRREQGITAPAGDGRAGDRPIPTRRGLPRERDCVLAAVKVIPRPCSTRVAQLLADRKFAEKAVKLDWRCLASVADPALTRKTRGGGSPSSPRERNWR